MGTGFGDDPFRLLLMLRAWVGGLNRGSAFLQRVSLGTPKGYLWVRQIEIDFTLVRLRGVRGAWAVQRRGH